MNRIKYLLNLKHDPWFKRVFKKLNNQEIEIAIRFTELNNDLDVNKFEKKINRMFLDKDRPKHWKEISELLSTANIKSKGDL